MLKDTPSPPLPDAPSAAITNNKVALAVLPPPSPSSPALDLCACMSNLFQDAQENRLSDLPLTGYSPAKKEGWRRMRSAGISPRETGAFNNVDHSSNSDNSEDDDYSPTPIINVI